MDERRAAIIAAAQRFIYTKGYEQMTVQDILNELGISKGAFYHYFDSKQAVLEALMEQLQAEAEQMLLPVVRDPALPALAKLQRLLSDAGRWKTGQKALMLALLRTWYADENALVRQKQTALGSRRIAPLFAAIVCQGAAEGVFSTPHPEQAGEILFALGESVSNAIARLVLAEERPAPGTFERMCALVAAYNEAIERVLGAPSGSIRLIEPEVLRDWFEET